MLRETITDGELLERGAGDATEYGAIGPSLGPGDGDGWAYYEGAGETPGHSGFCGCTDCVHRRRGRKVSA